MKVDNILIKRVGEVRKGISQATGNAWSARNILLTGEDETGELFINAVVDEGVWQQLGLHEGETASLHLRFRTKPFQSGFVANDIRIINPQNLN